MLSLHIKEPQKLGQTLFKAAGVSEDLFDSRETDRNVFSNLVGTGRIGESLPALVYAVFFHRSKIEPTIEVVFTVPLHVRCCHLQGQASPLLQHLEKERGELLVFSKRHIRQETAAGVPVVGLGIK